ncbi:MULTISPECIES: DUF2894 domain-containing protein [unclassified Lysobacter]
MPDKATDVRPQLNARREQGADHAGPGESADVPAPSPLRALLDHIDATRGPAEPLPHPDHAAAPAPPTHAALPALAEFQQLWNRVRTDSQLRRSLAAVPEDAGPLHSSALLHRAMRLMHDASPGYLQHFIGYVDALSWMEQLQEDGVLEPPTPARSGKTRPRKRTKPRRT